MYSKLVLVVENSRAEQLQWYPNPVQSGLSIVINNEARGSGQISLYDPAGRKLMQEQITKTAAQMSTVLDMHALSQGLYVIEVQIGNSFRVTKTVSKE